MFLLICYKFFFLNCKRSIIAFTFDINQVGWCNVFRVGGLHFDTNCIWQLKRPGFLFFTLIRPSTIRSMHSFVWESFNVNWGDDGSCFNLVGNFVDYCLVFFNNSCCFIVWAPKPAQFMGLPFAFATIVMANVIDNCLFITLCFLVTLQ